MSSSASSTAGTPEEQPVNDSALTAIDPEQNAPENATDQVESEAPTRVYLHPEQLAMIQTPEALPVPVLQRSVLRISYVPAICPASGSTAGTSVSATVCSWRRYPCVRRAAWTPCIRTCA